MTTQVTDRSCATRTTVPLTFTHRLSDIRVTAYNQQSASITVKSVSLLGMKYTGTLTGNSWALSGSANSAASHPFTLSLNNTITSGQTADLTGSNKHFMVIPQTIASGTQMIKVVTEEGGEERIYTHTLTAATALAMGTAYTYRLTLGNGQMKVSTETNINDWEKPFLKFKALESGSFSLRLSGNMNTSQFKNISYSLDGGVTWTTTQYTGSGMTITTPTVTAGNTVIWKGNGETLNNSQFSSTGRFEASGSVMSLLNEDNSRNNEFYPSTTNIFKQLFKNCTGLVKAPELPARTLVEGCYWDMFSGCTNLTEPPVLPARTLAKNCYAGMFQNCSSLTTAPELPVTILADNCYDWMFKHCTSLTKAPDLPAPTLTDYCYRHMFWGCTSLSYIKMMATNISASGCLEEWVKDVPSDGTFVKASSLTLGTGVNGIPSGWTVQNE